MAIVSDRRNYGQILSTAIATRRRGIENLMAQNNPLWNVLSRRNNIRTFTGPEIRQSVKIGLQEAQWFRGYDILKNSPVELINDARWNPKQVVAPISLTGEELRANEGSTRVHDIMEIALDSAEESLRNNLDLALHGDGTADGGKAIVGLGAALPINPALGTYAGISRVDNPIWRTTTFDAASDFPDVVPSGQDPAVDATTIRGIYTRAIRRRSANGRAADMLIASEEHYMAYDASLVAHQRVVNSNDAGNVGFAGPSLEFLGAGMRARVYPGDGINSNMPEHTTYGIESRSLFLYQQEGWNFAPLFDGGGQMPINQDAIAQFIIWVGELALVNPLYSWRLIDTSVE